ncbi:MAG: hypothetical protein C5B53_06710 [Candidatus Melainabacteria bacterium]|nr:MAG: hypothetical protein C5B53_06710 [Candidatus Melainabacteria bacterium]
MTFLSHSRASLATLAIVPIVLAGFVPASVLAQDSGYLKGTVRAEDFLPSQPGASLKRKDLGKDADAFGGGPQQSAPVQEINPRSGDFDTMQMPTPPPQTPFNLNANMNGGMPSFDGIPEQPGSDLPPEFVPRQQQPQTSMLPPRTMPPNLQRQDPDTSPELKIAWDEWHRRVAQAIYVRYNAMAQLAFRYSRPLEAYVSYTVTRDGRVLNVQLQRKSPNIAYNTMILLVVNSISGQKDLLAFPQGSRRMTVEKGGMFMQNCGAQGFKYITGDGETVRPH